MQPPGFLIRLPRKSFQTDTEAKRCGPLQQTLPNIYKFVCHISCNTLSQLTRHARTLWKLKAQANCYVPSYEWATLTNLCVWLGDHWVFWGLTVSWVPSLQYVDLLDAKASRTCPSGHFWVTSACSVSVQDQRTFVTLGLLVYLTPNTCVFSLMCLWFGLILQVIKAKLTV